MNDTGAGEIGERLGGVIWGKVRGLMEGGRFWDGEKGEDNWEVWVRGSPTRCRIYGRIGGGKAGPTLVGGKDFPRGLGKRV